MRRSTSPGSSLPSSTYPNSPGVLSAAPSGNPPVSPLSPAQPPVLSAQPPRPNTAAQPPVLAAQPPRPTPGVLPFAGQGWAEFPRWAAMAGLGLVGTGLGLRLRQRLAGTATIDTPPADTDGAVEERPFDPSERR